MCAPAFIAWSKPASSLHMSVGSAQVMPLVPHQCCGPAILVVAFTGAAGWAPQQPPAKLRRSKQA